jgi:uncharacterized protein (TIGR02246 family)
MVRRNQLMVALVAVVLAVAWLVAGGTSGVRTQDQVSSKAPVGGTQDSPEMAAVRKTAEAFVKAFNAGDAKAVAGFWAPEGEYVGPDGEELRGRDAIEKSYIEIFQKHPKARMEIDVGSVRMLGRHTALEEGTVKVYLPGETEAGATRYTALHVHDDDGWRLASVREWVPDPAELVSLQDLAWLVGTWVAKGKDDEVRVTYAWDEDRTTLHGRYVVKKDGKEVSSGTQVIGKDPAQGLRAMLFDKHGAFGESVWSRDGSRWIVASNGSLPNGSEVLATNIVIPMGKDAFTWQSVERTADGVALPDLPPVRVTRVQATK